MKALLVDGDWGLVIQPHRQVAGVTPQAGMIGDTVLQHRLHMPVDVSVYVLHGQFRHPPFAHIVAIYNWLVLDHTKDTKTFYSMQKSERGCLSRDTLLNQLERLLSREIYEHCQELRVILKRQT